MEKLSHVVLVSNGLPTHFMNLIWTPQAYAIGIDENHSRSGDRKQFPHPYDAKNKWPHKVITESVVTRVYDDLSGLDDDKSILPTLQIGNKKVTEYFCNPRKKGYVVLDRMIQKVDGDPYHPDLSETTLFTADLPLSRIDPPTTTPNLIQFFIRTLQANLEGKEDTRIKV